VAPQPLRGSIRVPGDKSLSHRVALFSALAEGTSRVRGLLDSLDVRSTLAAISALGARVELDAEGCASDVDRRSDRGTFLLSTARWPQAEGAGGRSGAHTRRGAAGPPPPSHSSGLTTETSPCQRPVRPRPKARAGFLAPSPAGARRGHGHRAGLWTAGTRAPLRACCLAS
jgi:3-phosphoshikimate 1-carboxyvinyltransferase